MRANRGVVLVALGILVGVAAVPAAAEDPKAACSPEVARAQAMVAEAQEVIRASKGKGAHSAGTPLGGPGSSGAGASQGDPGSSAARGLATSAASEISPWSPRPTDKTLQARTLKARTLTARAAKLCAGGKIDDARAKAIEAITVLDPR